MRSIRATASSVALALLVACSSTPAQVSGLTRLDEPMPALAGPTLDGGTFGPQDHADSVMVVNFWASWCAPCRREQPMLQSLSEEYASRGVVFVGVNSRDQEAAAKAHLDEFGVTYPSVQDPDGKVAFEWGINQGLPATVVVDGAGIIRYRRQGEITQPTLETMIEDTLAAPASPDPSLVP
ncbi:MAG: TlpA disulfide reductase family protein [Actinomycetota bacterium]